MKNKNRFFDTSLLTLTDSSGTLKLFSLAIPIFTGLVFNILLGTVNTVALTYVSPEAVTAVNVANTLINIPIVLTNMIATGMLILLSLTLGGGRREAVGDICRTGLYAVCIFSVLLSVILGFSAQPLLEAMNLSGKALSLGKIYFIIRIIFIIFTAVTNSVTAILRAHGYAKPTMLSGIISNAVNAAGSLFVVSPMFGGNKIAGVATVAVIGQLCGMVYAVVKLSLTSSVNKQGRFTPQRLWHMLKVGVPSGISLFAYTVSGVYSTSVLASLGEDVITIKVYASTISNYTYLFGYAVAQAAAIMIGRLVGAGNYKKANRLFSQTARTVPIINICLALLVFLFSDTLMQIFTTDTSALKTAHLIFLIDIFIEAARGLSQVGENSLCSVEDTVFTSSVAVPACIIIGMLCCRIFSISLGLGVFGYYTAAILDEATRSTVYLFRWRSGRWAAHFKKQQA